MTPAQRAAMRALAKAATPGPWYVVGHPWNPDGPAYIIAEQSDPHVGRPVCDFAMQRDEETGEPDTEDNGYADADFIAAHSPEVIEGLLDDLDAAEQKFSVLRDAVNSSGEDCTPGCSSYGHAEGCKTCDPASWLAKQQERIATLEAREKRLREAIEQAVKRINGAALHQMHEAAEDEVREALLYLGAALAEPDAQGTPR